MQVCHGNSKYRGFVLEVNTGAADKEVLSLFIKATLTELVGEASLP